MNKNTDGRVSIDPERIRQAREFQRKEYNISKEEGKPCWLFKYDCPCRTGCCLLGVPGNDCGTYRWFKELIEYNKRHHPERA